MIDAEGILVGSDVASDLQLSEMGVEPRQALIFKSDAETASAYSSYHVKSLAQGVTYLNGKQLNRDQIEELSAGDTLHFGPDATDSTSFKIKLRHISERENTPDNKQQEALLS